MKKSLRKIRTKRRRQRPTLRFSPTVWAKLLFWRDRGPCEVGAFGISAKDDLLYVKDLALLPQECTWGSVRFEDEAVANYFDHQVDQGLRPEQFARIWLHTHPGNSPLPSVVDDETFSRVFGRADWAVMGILAKGGSSYARLRFAAGPGGDFEIPLEVDFDRRFAATDLDSWDAEYVLNVRRSIEVASLTSDPLDDFRSHDDLHTPEEMFLDEYSL